MYRDTFTYAYECICMYLNSIKALYNNYFLMLLYPEISSIYSCLSYNNPYNNRFSPKIKNA